MSTIQVSQDTSIDIALVKRVQQGNKQAYDLLITKYQYKLASALYSYVKDHSEVYDVVQESFIKAYNNINDFRGDSSFYSWLYRIAINTAKNYLKTKKRRPPRQDIDAGDESGEIQLINFRSPESILEQQRLNKKIRESIDALPDNLKLVFNLQEVQGLNYEEIAKSVAIPIGTVRSRLFRARQLLTDALQSYT